MIRAVNPIARSSVKHAVKAALARIQQSVRATEVPPDVLPFQPAAWLVSWPAIAALWAIAGLIAYCRLRGYIQ